MGQNLSSYGDVYATSSARSGIEGHVRTGNRGSKLDIAPTELGVLYVGSYKDLAPTELFPNEMFSLGAIILHL